MLPLATFVVLASLAARADLTLPAIDVTGSSVTSADEIGGAVSELKGVRLEQKRRGTIGDTLRSEAGVTATDYGSNASRPVIRGLGGDRVRILQNGTGVLDASGASDDHAVAVDPLAVDKIEVVRGPAALLYGSQAIGGVVNLLTARVPAARPNIPNGRAEAQYSSNDDGRAGGLGLDSSVGDTAAVHVDVSARGHDDYRVPVSRHVLNSQGRVLSGGLGASTFFDNGYFGAAISDYETSYGTIAEEFTTINMRQRRLDLAGELRLSGFVHTVRLKNTFSLYGHEELEEGVESTRFRNVGDEARADFVHQTFAGFTGRFGAQINGFDFSALGEEAFVPKTQTRSGGVFAYEERATGRWRPSVGARAEFTSAGADANERFGAGVTKEFVGLDASLGLNFMISSQNKLGVTASYVERAPNYQELFANGPHPATRVYEVGDRVLDKERARAYELFWRHEGTGNGGRVGVFAQDFDNFIALVPTGTTDADSGMGIYDFRAVGARLIGAEAEYRWALPLRVPGGALEFGLRADVVRGENRADRTPLPRITPVRETASITYKGEHWRGDAEVQRSERQTRVANFETPTPGYTMVNLSAEVPLTHFIADASGFVRLNNAFNVEARNHVSLLKDVAPLPGRSIVAGLRATF